MGGPLVMVGAVFPEGGTGTGHFRKGNFVTLTWLASRTDQAKCMHCTTYDELNENAC